MANPFGKLKNAWNKAANAGDPAEKPQVHHLGELVSKNGSVRVDVGESMEKVTLCSHPRPRLFFTRLNDCCARFRKWTWLR